MNEFNKAMRQLTMIGQLGLSLLMPLLICLLACYLLTVKCGVGGWVYIPGFILGLGSSFMTAWKFYKSVLAKDKKEEKNKKVSFNTHE